MRKTLLVTFVLLIVAALAVAQQGNNSQAPSTASPSQQSSAPQTAPSETAIEGCLGGAAGNFTVTDKAGMVYKLQLPDDAHSAVLEKHVGQEVQVKGMVESASAPDSVAAPDSKASKDAAGEGSKSQATIKPTSMEKIADTCSAKTEASAEKK